MRLIKARLGVAQRKTKSDLRKHSRLVAMRAPVGSSQKPTSQFTTCDDQLDKVEHISDRRFVMV